MQQSIISSNKIDKLLYFVGIAFLFWFLFTFLFGPLLSAYSLALFDNGELKIASITEQTFSSKRVVTAIFNTVWLAVIGIVTVSIIGIFQVLTLEYFYIRGRFFLKIAFATPLVFGGIVAAIGYKFTYGPTGIATQAIQYFIPSFNEEWFIGPWGVLYTQTFLLTGYYYLFLRAAMRKVDYSSIEAARSLGASDWLILKRVVFPIVTPTIFAVVIMVTYVGISAFSVPEVIGGRDFVVISQIVLTLGSIGRPDMAAYLALLMSFVIMALIFFSQWVEKKNSYHGGVKIIVPIELKHISNPLVNFLLHSVSYALAIICIVPVILVVIFSFAPGSSIGVEVLPSSLTIKNYITVFSNRSVFSPLFNSVFMSFLAAMIGVVISLFAASLIAKNNNWLGRVIDIGFYTPWVIPTVLLAVGFISFFDTNNFWVGNNILLGSFVILPIAYMVWQLPFFIRFLRAAFIGIDPCYEDAARSMGAPALYRFRRVIFPIVLPAAVLAATNVFNELITEYPLSAFLYNINNKPLAIAMLQSDRSTDVEAAAISLVYSVFAIVLTLCALLIAERIGLGKGPKVNKL